MTSEVSSPDRSNVLDSEIGTEVSENSVLIRRSGDGVPSDSGIVDGAHFDNGLSKRSKLALHTSIMLSSLGGFVRLVVKSASFSST